MIRFLVEGRKRRWFGRSGRTLDTPVQIELWGNDVARIREIAAGRMGHGISHSIEWIEVDQVRLLDPLTVLEDRRCGFKWASQLQMPLNAENGRLTMVRWRTCPQCGNHQLEGKKGVHLLLGEERDEAMVALRLKDSS